MSIKTFTPDSHDAYKPGKGLLAAIHAALLLQRPLLLSGEPGTGKTACADYIARQLKRQFPEQFTQESAFRFNTKSVSQSSDLFYQYDVVAHFGDKSGKPKTSFIQFNTLGTAILCTQAPSKELESFINYKSQVADRNPPFGSVVLIDEIDKAPRDFPNDLLAELEKPPFRFSMKELPDAQFVQSVDKPIVLVITSNNEKGLPDAFLRRCVFHHIPFPDAQALKEIIQANLRITHPGMDAAIERFLSFRRMNLVKKPATSELIDWIACIHAKELLGDQLSKWTEAEFSYKQQMQETLCLLAKSKADIETLSEGLRG